MEDGKVTRFCECNSFHCKKVMELPLEEVKKIAHNEVTIIDGCPTGPSPGDVFVRKMPGYTVYREETRSW